MYIPTATGPSDRKDKPLQRKLCLLSGSDYTLKSVFEHVSSSVVNFIMKKLGNDSFASAGAAAGQTRPGSDSPTGTLRVFLMRQVDLSSNHLNTVVRHRNYGNNEWSVV